MLHSGPDAYAEAPPCLILKPMSEHSPIISEFDTPQEQAAYEEWLRAKVAASLADTRPPVPHDEAMARIRAIIKERSGRGEA